MPQIIGINKSGSPIGTIKSFSGASAPQNFLLCYGQAISRTTYAALFAIIGTTYGVGDGSTTFNLPDLRGRTLAGKDNMGGSAAGRLTSGGSGVDGVTLGATGGAETHTLTTAQLATHNHGGVTGAHSHTVTSVSSAGGLTPNSGSGAIQGPAPGTATSSATSTISNDGGGGAHQNTQPTIVINYIISFA